MAETSGSLQRSNRAILTVAQIAAADAQASEAGTPLLELMERAGAEVFQAVVARWTPRPTVVLCGPGNNGGDGYVAARRLREAGWPVRVAALVPPAGLAGAAGEAAGTWGAQTEAVGEACVVGAELVVDALFGAGLTHETPAPAQAALRAAQASAAPLVAVDLPSGLSGDTGAPLGFAPRAALTVSFHRKKIAHVLEPGRSLCGELAIADIGLPDPQGPHALLENGPEIWLADYPWPAVDTHKTARGRMIVVSGPAWRTGAARLSARAGLRIGAGLVTILSPPDALSENAAHLEAVMLRPLEDAAAVRTAAEGVDVAVIGPGAGVGEATRDNLLALAAAGARLVVDADALTSFRETPQELFGALDAGDVLTPHPGEFERVFPRLLARCPERISAARQAAAQAGAVVLLKGSDTVVAAPDGRAIVNTNAAPWLATAGSGDVLAGFIAGLIAQGMASFEAAAAGAWIHAEAGRTFGPGLIAEDLPGQAPAILRRLLERGAQRSAPSTG